jgi:hypothetical protein
MVLPVCDLSSLGDPFGEEEVLAAIKSLPIDNALDRMATLGISLKLVGHLAYY